MSDSPQQQATKQPAPATHVAGSGQRQLVLVKAGQRFIFRFASGEESQLLEGLARMARDPESDFSWFDAAVLSHQMGSQMSQRFKQLMKAS